MLKYAREDTHYLLYVYDELRGKLVERGAKHNPQNQFQFLLQTLHKSNALCLKTYEKPVLKDFNYHMIVQRH